MSILYIAGLVLAFYLGTFCFFMYAHFKDAKRKSSSTLENYMPYYIHLNIDNEYKCAMIEPEVIASIIDTDDVERIANEIVDNVMTENPHVCKKQLQEEIIVKITDILLIRGLKCI